MRHLENILDKQNQWWRYLVMFLTVFVAANFIGGIPLLLVIAFKSIQGDGAVNADSSVMMDLSQYGIDQNLMLVLMLIPFIISLVFFALLIKPLNKQSFKEVINGTDRIRWRKFFYAFFVWIVIMAIYLIIEISLNPDNFILNFSLWSFVPLVLIAIILIPFQTSFEEVMFRGYLSQGVAAWTNNRLMVVLIPAIMFGMMHVFNPEIKEYGFWITMPQYIIFGIVFGLIIVFDDGIETAMGAHAANNIFLSIFVTFKASALQTPALFVQKELDPVKDLITLIVISFLFVFILYRKYKWDIKVLFLPVKSNAD
jgi:hypothetical protein